jgi:tetratricopeptide (TPR) repeat protein
VLSPKQLAQRLDQRFRLLSGGERGAIERHATLRAAIDWSYDLLDHDQQRLLARLAVFAGGCSLDAVEAVCSANGIEEVDVLDLLTALVARSLVLADDVAWGDRRYRLLETIRQYAEEHLDAIEQGKLRDRHADFYANFVEAAVRGLQGPDQLRWLMQVEPELENVKIAMAWAVANDDAVRAERFLSSAVDADRGPLTTALLRDADAVLQLPSIHTIPRYPYAIMAGAVAALFHGRYDRAEQLCQQALDVAGEPDDELEGGTELVRAMVARMSQTSDLGMTIEHQQRALRCFRRCASPYHVVSVLNPLASFRASSGDLATAADNAREALALARQTGNPGLISAALAGLAFVLVDSEPERSRTLIAESLELTDRLGPLAVDEQALLLTITACARLGDRHLVLRRAAPALDRGFSGITRLGVCLEVTAAALAPDAPEPAAVLHRHIDALVPGLAQSEPQRTNRERATAAIHAQLDPTRIAELRAQGAALTQYEAVAYALDAIARVLANVSPESATGQ